MSNAYPQGFFKYKQVLQEKGYPHHFSEMDVVCHHRFAESCIGSDYRDNPAWRYYEMIPLENDQHRHLPK